jgi:hypothetical protein
MLAVKMDNESRVRPNIYGPTGSTIAQPGPNVYGPTIVKKLNI